MQIQYATEAKARDAARGLGNMPCQIIQSRPNADGKSGETNPVDWERLVFTGRGKQA